MGQTRVPPPPTGVVGRGDFSQSPLPPANAGAAISPLRDYASPGNYWQRNGSGPGSMNGEASPSTSNVSDTRVREGDRLNWLDPASKETPGRAFEYGDPSVVAFPTAAGYSNPQSEFQPRFLPRTGSVTPLAAGPRSNPAVVSSPPRVRGFSHAGVQELRVPAELAEFQGNAVRQASGSTQEWQSRY
jgi:hypothetical protein